MSYIAVFLKDDGSDEEILVLSKTRQDAIRTLKRKKIPIVNDAAGKIVYHLMMPHKVKRKDSILLCDSIDRDSEDTIYPELAEAAGIKLTVWELP